MSKKIFGTLKDGRKIIIFDDSYNKFQEFEKLFEVNYLELKPISFLENLNATLNDNEIFFIQLQQEDLTELQKIFNLYIDTIDLNKISKDNYKIVNSVYLVDSNSNKIIIKRILPTQVIKARTILNINFSPEFKKETDSIILYKRNDIIFDKKELKIYFLNFNTLRYLFPKIFDYYKEVSDDEIKKFFRDDKFQFNKELLSKISNKLKKRISIIINSKKVNFDNKNLMKKYEEYDLKFRNKIKKENGKYIIKNKSELENFIDVIEESLYKTPITEEKREADAFRKLKL